MGAPNCCFFRTRKYDSNPGNCQFPSWLGTKQNANPQRFNHLFMFQASKESKSKVSPCGLSMTQRKAVSFPVGTKPGDFLFLLFPFNFHPHIIPPQSSNRSAILPNRPARGNPSHLIVLYMFQDSCSIFSIHQSQSISWHFVLLKKT